MQIRCADCGCLPKECADARAGLSDKCPKCKYDQCCCVFSGDQKDTNSM